MMRNEPLADLLRYRLVIIQVALAILLVTGLLIAGASIADAPKLRGFFSGIMLGLVLATINVLALGHAFYALYIKKSSPIAFGWALGTFLLLVSAALMTVRAWPELTLGFALAQVFPLFFGLAIAFMCSHPLDQGE